MSIARHLQSRSTEELLYLCEIFNVKPLKTDAGTARHLAKKLMEPEVFRNIYQQLTQNEIEILKFYAEHQQQYNYLNENTKMNFPNLVHFGYLRDNEDGNEIEVSLELINLYIELIDQRLPQIKEPSISEHIDEITRKAEIKNDEIKEQTYLKNVQRQLDDFENYSLQDCLLFYSNEDLKDICRFYGIKGFSSKSKIELVKLISKSFFKDFDMLQKMIAITPAYLLEMIEAMLRLDLKFVQTEMELDLVLEYFYFTLETDNIFVIPNDVLSHIKKYREQHVLSQVVERKLFYKQLINLYGAVEYRHIQKMVDKLLAMQLTELQVKKEISNYFSQAEVVIEETLVRHIHWKDVPLEQLERPAYFEPLMKQLEPFVDETFIDDPVHCTALHRLLKKYARGLTPIEINSLNAEIKKSIRISFHFEPVINYINQLIEIGKFESQLMKELPDLLTGLYKQARLWMFAGNLIPQDSVKNKKDEKKKRQRKKGINVSRIAKLDDYR